MIRSTLPPSISLQDIYPSVHDCLNKLPLTKWSSLSSKTEAPRSQAATANGCHTSASRSSSTPSILSRSGSHHSSTSGESRSGSHHSTSTNDESPSESSSSSNSSGSASDDSSSVHSSSHSAAADASDSDEDSVDFHQRFLIPFTDLVQGNNRGHNPLTLEECTTLLKAMIAGEVPLLGNMTLPERTNDWLSTHPTWLPIASLLADLEHAVDFKVMKSLLNAIENRSFDYQPDVSSPLTTLFIRCMLNSLQVMNLGERIAFFKQVMDTIAIIAVDLEKHTGNEYWIPILKDLTYGFKELSDSEILLAYKNNAECVQWHGIPQVASNDPFQYFMWLLEQHSSAAPEGNNNYAARLNVFMTTLNTTWGNYFPNRTLVSVRAETDLQSPVYFIYTESGNRRYVEGSKVHNLQRASTLPWFEHATGTLFEGRRSEILTAQKHSALHAEYEAALSEYNTDQLKGWGLRAGVVVLSSIAAWCAGKLLSSYLYRPTKPSTPPSNAPDYIDPYRNQGKPLLPTLENAGNGKDTYTYEDLEDRINRGGSKNPTLYPETVYTTSVRHAHKTGWEKGWNENAKATAISTTAAISTAVATTAATTTTSNTVFGGIANLITSKELADYVARQPLFAF